MSWTDEQIDLLTNLWKSGWSASQISRKLGGASRNAVLGKIYRLRLAGEQQLGRAGGPSVRSPSGPRKPRMSMRAAVCEEQTPGLANIVTLEAHMCRWPIGDPQDSSFTFCGRSASGVYCGQHRAAAYTPQRRPAAAPNLARRATL
jgi:GcrA cell cycle regulator